jgi:hypothetical protein
MAFRNWLFMACIGIAISSCGGGGGGTSSSTVAGTVAIGSPLAGATVEAKCAKGSGTTTTKSDGSFSLALAGVEFPCAMKATGGTIGGGGANSEVLVSIATAAGTVNITPITHLIVAKAMGKQPNDVFNAFGANASDISAATSAKLSSAQTAIASEIAKLGINANFGSTDLLTVTFSAITTDPVDQFTSVVYSALTANSKTLTSAAQEIIATASGLQIIGTPKGICRPGVIAGFKGSLGTDQKLAFVPIDFNFGTDNGGGGGGSGSGGDGTGGDGSLGQFLSTTVIVEKADGTELGRAKTSESSGAFTMITCGYTGPIKVTMTGTTGSKYFDEALNQTVSFEGESMRVVIPSVTKNIGVTPFTEAAYRYLVTKLNPSGLTGTAAWADAQRISLANDQILKVVNQLLPKEFFLTDITRMPAVIGPSTTAGSIPDSANGIYGLVVAALAIQTKGYNPTLTRPGLDSLKQLADDLADGSLDRRGTTAGQNITSASGAAYTPDNLAQNVASSVGLLAKQTAVPSLANQTYVVTRINWLARGTSYRNQLPTILKANGSIAYGPYAFVDLLSNGSIRVVHPITLAVLADSLDVTKSPMFVPTAGLQTKFVQLTGSTPMFLALDSNGVLYAAGDGGPRQGNGVTGDQPLMHTVPSNWGGAKVSTISHNGGDEAFARTSDGRIWGWGTNQFGQMGSVNTDSFTPASLFPSIPDFVSVNMAGNSAFGIKADGTVWSWGQNTIDGGASPPTYGRLGRGSSPLPSTNVIAQISGLSNVKQVAPSAKAVFALTGSKEIYAWGNNFCGVLGDSVNATAVFAATPSKLSLTDVIAVGSSAATGYALKSDGTLIYWGSLPANPLDPKEAWDDRPTAVCQRLPIAVPLAGSVGLPAGIDNNTKFVKLESIGFGVIATTANKTAITLYGSNAK